MQNITPTNRESVPYRQGPNNTIEVLSPRGWVTYDPWAIAKYIWAHFGSTGQSLQYNENTELLKGLVMLPDPVLVEVARLYDQNNRIPGRLADTVFNSTPSGFDSEVWFSKLKRKFGDLAIS